MSALAHRAPHKGNVANVWWVVKDVSIQKMTRNVEGAASGPPSKIETGNKE